jgi:two-component system sensor histidine kinase HydH
MKPSNSAERAKPFRLVKYFTFTSLIVIFIGTIILSVLNTHWVRSIQYQKSEDYALLLIENLNHQVFLQFIVPVGLKYGKIELRNQEQFERMDSVVRSTLHSFKVEMVNIYGKKDIIATVFRLIWWVWKTSAELFIMVPWKEIHPPNWFKMVHSGKFF